MRIETIISALKQALATYETLRMKETPGKYREVELVDFHRILKRIESHGVEPEIAILWVFRFCEHLGSHAPLAYCLLSELSKLMHVPLWIEGVLQHEIQRLLIEPANILQNETIAAFNVIREQKAMLDSLIEECKEGLGALITQDLMTFKLRTIH